MADAIIHELESGVSKKASMLQFEALKLAIVSGGFSLMFCLSKRSDSRLADRVTGREDVLSASVSCAF